MTTSEQCWVTGQCKRYKWPNCECKFTDNSCTKLDSLRVLYDKALLTEKQRQHVTLLLDENSIDREAFIKLSKFEQNIKDFVQNGENIYLHSSITGNGKTEWAVRLVQAYLNAVWVTSGAQCKALFINVPRFLLELKSNISNHSEYIDHIMQNVLDADLVVWDEIATKSLTTYEHEHLLSLINARLDSGKSNIYTSNMSANELQEKLGDRLYSRIVGYSHEIIFNGQDKRGAIQ